MQQIDNLVVTHHRLITPVGFTGGASLYGAWVRRFRPCERYEEDEFLFNPYGYIRLEPEE